MKITPHQYAAALFYAVSETAPNDHDKVLDNFVKILAQNGDLGKYEEIDLEFRKIKMEAQGIKEAEVTVAREAEINSNIVHELNRIVSAGVGADSIRPLQVKTKVDESLIGGVVVRVDDTLIDASVKTQLNNLNNSLKS
ncbi:MAG: ATP synthase F1 subunit delta [Candidatus Doudnabacteria bacterium]|nr:ATP synthase F1 subunit delta [Candidatus Doudnabacteria bacterium]